MSLQLDALSYRIAGTTIIEGLNWTVPQGARYCLMAGNGAGKTTLLNLISGVLRPQGGEILWCNQKITRQSIETRYRLGIARSFQSSHLFPHLTVGQSVQLALPTGARVMTCRTPVTADSDLTIDTMIARILAPYWNQLTGALSYGTQRLLEVSLALLSRPLLLILDEPFAGLSIKTKQEMSDLLQHVPASCSMIMVEHDVVSAYPLTTHAVILSQGKMVLNQSWQRLLASPDSLADAIRYYRGVEKLLPFKNT